MEASFETSVVLDSIEKNLVLRLISGSHRPSSDLVSRSVYFSISKVCQYCKTDLQNYFQIETLNILIPNFIIQRNREI